MSQTSLLFLRDLLPPVVSRPLARRFLGIRYTGNYATWGEAARRSQGYQTPDILAQVIESARAARDGRAAFERDGVAFHTPSYRWPLLGCLLAEAAGESGRLRVLDFGGSLGSVYFQHRGLLRDLREVRWAVVEQRAFVEAGRREFAGDQLSFHHSIEEAMQHVAPTVVLFSAVLAWVEQPHATLQQAIATGVRAIILDRTPMTGRPNDVVKVQRVPSRIYRASYPCWFLSRSGILARFRGHYELRAELPQLHDAVVPGVTFGGLYMTKLNTL